MDLKEINNLSLIHEIQHWWIKTRFLYIEKTLQLINKKNLTVLEVGCGSAQNLYYLRHISSFKGHIKKVIAFDPNLKDKSRFDWMHTNDMNVSSIESHHLKNEKIDLILAMDVMEHIQDDKNALLQWSSLLKEGGTILITVPAFMCLWSKKDELLDHKRRYKKDDLLLLTNQFQLKPFYHSYAFSYLFPIILLIVKLFSKKSNQSLELKKTNSIINSVL